MKLRMTILLGSCAILMLGLRAPAQDVVVPAVGAPAAAPAGPNLFTMILPPPEMAERCRQKLCKCEIVKLMRASLAGPSALTGGIIPVGNCCPTIKKEDLLKPADSAEGAAARIMKDAEEAKARREAVRILGTVDCRYWPEAEDGLINALRADKIECVRYEAALQLQRGCCCTKKIAKALTICIEGSDKDGFPAERSCRVKDAAAMALSMCIFEEKVEPKEPTEGDKKRIGRVDPKDFYRNVEVAANEKVYEGARKALEARGPMTSTQVLSQPHRAGSQGLFGMLGHAFESSNDPTTEATREPQPVVASAPQPAPQPQRRGLLYKILPGEEQATYAPPIQAPVPTTPSVVPPPIKVQPVTTTIAPPAPKTVATTQPTAPKAAPTTITTTPRPLPAGDVRPVSYSTPAFTPYRSTPTTDEPAFSTAGPSSGAPPRPILPPSSSSSTPSRSEQGQPGTISMPPSQLGLIPVETPSTSTPRPTQGQPGFVLFNEEPPTRR